MTAIHQCGQFSVAMIGLSVGLTVVALLFALIGLAATQSRYPEYGIASAFGAATIVCSVGGLAVGWRGVGALFLLLVPAFPVLCGGLVFVAIRSMKNSAIARKSVADAQE